MLPPKTQLAHTQGVLYPRAVANFGSEQRDADTHVAHKSCHTGVTQKVRACSDFLRARVFLIMRLLWLLTALVLAFALAVLHTYALDAYLYWRYVWLDVPVHFLGGLAIGSFIVGFLPRFSPLLFVLMLAGAVIGWEVFEYFVGTPKEANFIFDTSLDVLIGTLGGMVTYAIARYTLWQSK